MANLKTKALEAEYRPLFWRQLAGLLRSGVSLPDALLALGRDTDSPRIRQLTDALRIRVEDGEPLSEAAQSLGAFDVATVACLRAAESSGLLPVICGMLADHEERSRRMRLRARMVLAYPVVLWISGLTLSSTLFFTLAPGIGILEEELRLANPLLAPPLAVRWSMSAAYGLNGLFLAMALAALAATYAWARPRRWPRARRRIERFVLRMPVWSRYWRAVLLGRFFRGLSTLLGAGLPLDRSLELAGTASGSMLLEDAASRAAAIVRDGGRASTGFEAGGVLSAAALWSLATAEERGDLVQTASELADCYDETAEVGGSTVLAVLEPAAIATVGVLAALMVLAVALPAMNVSALVN